MCSVSARVIQELLKEGIIADLGGLGGIVKHVRPFHLFPEHLALIIIRDVCGRELPVVDGLWLRGLLYQESTRGVGNLP